jgi:hypothetical protein
VTAKEMRQLIGKLIEWEGRRPPGYPYVDKYSGWVEDVQGKNVLINGDWKWLPHMFNVKVLPDPPAQAAPVH